MLLQEETVVKFGYTVGSLSDGSSKKICLQCDYCQRIYESTYKQYNKTHNIISKDACIKCKYFKRKDISLVLYGVENSSQRPEVRKKISQNCEGFDDKRRAIMKKKYGVENPMENAELKERQKQSVINKYGVENVSQVKEVREKVEATNLKKYGNRQFLGSEIGQEKKREGMLNKYGVENAFEAEEVKQKIRETNMKKFGFDHHFKDKDKAILNAKKVVESKIKAGTIKLYDGKPISEWLKQSRYSDSAFRTLINRHGFELALKMSPQISSLEQIIKEWLDIETIKYQQQFHIGNKIADFLLSDYNIILELDGLYWHSEHQIKDNFYHINKHSLYTSFNYVPLFFREDEIYNKLSIVKSIILNKMGKSIRIFARKCSVVEISRSESVKFCDSNHLMGKGRGTTYGLIYNNELVSVMVLRRKRNSDWEISRFCHKIGYQVVGGFSKLLSHFLKNNGVNILTTFIDQRYGSGKYLTDLGFKFIGCNPSFSWTNTLECVHRMKFPSNTGYNNGFVKIWDCGQARYDLQI